MSEIKFEIWPHMAPKAPDTPGVHYWCPWCKGKWTLQEEETTTACPHCGEGLPFRLNNTPFTDAHNTYQRAQQAFVDLSIALEQAKEQGWLKHLCLKMILQDTDVASSQLEGDFFKHWKKRPR